VYVAVTRTIDPLDQPIEYATIAGEEMLPWLRQIEGFQGLLMLSNEGDGSTLVLAFWESREVAERHHAARMQFRDRITAAVNVQVQETVGYEVTFADVGPLKYH
jgi:hypothetical protein